MGKWLEPSTSGVKVKKARREERKPAQGRRNGGAGTRGKFSFYGTIILCQLKRGGPGSVTKSVGRYSEWWSTEGGPVPKDEWR